MKNARKNARSLTALAALAALCTSASPAMAGGAPPTKEWSVWENRMPGVRIEPGKTTLLISGLVETTNGAIRPALRSKGPRNGEEDALEVELSLVESGGVGTTDIAYREVEELFIVPIYRYKRVYILFGGEEIEAGAIQVRPAY